MQSQLEELFYQWSGEKALQIEPLSAHGSNRKYFRIKGNTKECLGAFNADIKENAAFFSFSKSFKEHKFPVPEIFAVDTDQKDYLLEDLGNSTLFEYLVRKENRFDEDSIDLYKKVIEQLIRFQTEGNTVVDYSVCYPHKAFDDRSMHWDLNYFKYYFLKLAQIPFDENLLQNDFNTLIAFLKQAEDNFFLYRDFQSRNIMLTKENETLTPYFIDYQGGRKGALQYDLASLLFDGKVEMPPQVRTQLLEYYIQCLSKKIDIDKKKFEELFYGFVFIRIMQAMGSYGFRGFYEQKYHFLSSIPPALKNLEWLLNTVSLPIEIPTLRSIWKGLCESPALKKIVPIHQLNDQLTISIYSFSYKKSLPVDYSGNGGGFLFDCRALPNPGREARFKTLNGKDKEVQQYLENYVEVKNFLNHSFALVEQSVQGYLERNFTHLLVGYGCTGGQHRSVYCAEQLANYLSAKYNCNIILHHKEQ